MNGVDPSGVERKTSAESRGPPPLSPRGSRVGLPGPLSGPRTSLPFCICFVVFFKFQNLLAGDRLTTIEHLCTAGKARPRSRNHVPSALMEAGRAADHPLQLSTDLCSSGSVMDTAEQSWKCPSASASRSPTRQVGSEETLTNPEWTHCPRRLKQ